MLKLPSGNDAGGMDRIMLLATWAEHIEGKVYAAGMGKPTYPIDEHAVSSALAYWDELIRAAERAKPLEKQLSDHCEASTIDALVALNNETVQRDFDPRGEAKYRQGMAEAMNQWYYTGSAHADEITQDNIIFTVGGAGGIYIIFEMLKRRVPGGRILTPFPHYSLYGGRMPRLVAMNVMSQPGYRLTAAFLAESLAEAERSGKKISAVLLCDPNNPLGSVLTPEELHDFAAILSQEAYRHILIVLDEAYAEMNFRRDRHQSFLTLAPWLKNRIIIMRSATKGLSAAGERMAITMAFDPDIVLALQNINYRINESLPASLQAAYTGAMLKFDDAKLLDLERFYSPQIELVRTLVNEMGANMPDKDYQVEGSFYVLADMSDLIGTQLCSEARIALGEKDLISSDEDISYHLLFKYGVMIAPLSYFGHNAKAGFMRITCSLGQIKIPAMMKHIENALIEARKMKCEQLKEMFRTFFSESEFGFYEEGTRSTETLTPLARINNQFDEISAAHISEKRNAIRLKNILNDLQGLKTSENLLTRKKNTYAITSTAATTICRFFRGYSARKLVRAERERQSAEWIAFVESQLLPGISSENGMDTSVLEKIPPYLIRDLLESFHKSPHADQPESTAYLSSLAARI